MSQSILAQSTTTVQTFEVYEYSFSLFNPDTHDIQENLTAAFKRLPSQDDWKAWLVGWIDCGYRFYSVPRLVNIF